MNLYTKMHVIRGYLAACVLRSLLLFALAGPVCAELPAVASEPSAPGAEPGGNAALDLQQRIAVLEAELGAWDAQVGALVLEKALWHQRRGEHLQAVQDLESALHISKVNFGMHNPAQIEIAERLHESLSLLPDRDKSARNLHYLLWLHRRNYAAADDRLVSMLERVADWYLQSYDVQGRAAAVSDLVKADDLYDEAARNIRSQYGDEARQLISLLQASASVNYYLAERIRDEIRMSHRDLREAMLPNRRGTPHMNEDAVREAYFDRSFFKGKRALEKIIEIQRGSLPASLAGFAQSIVDLGDYYLALDRSWDALRNYQRAYAALLEYQAGAEVIEAIFGSPRQVEPFALRTHTAAGPETYIDAIVDIDSNGRVQVRSVLASEPPDDARLRVRARYALSTTRFRPRFENGRAVSSRGVSIRYVFRG